MRALQPAAEARKAEGASWTALQNPIPQQEQEVKPESMCYLCLD